MFICAFRSVIFCNFVQFGGCFYVILCSWKNCLFIFVVNFAKIKEYVRFINDIVRSERRTSKY